MYEKAFVEVLEIMNEFPKEFGNIVSKSFKEFAEKNKDNNYVFKYDKSKLLEEQVLLKETKILLSLLYRRFIRDKK